MAGAGGATDFVEIAEAATCAEVAAVGLALSVLVSLTLSISILVSPATSPDSSTSLIVTDVPPPPTYATINKISLFQKIPIDQNFI